MKGGGGEFFRNLLCQEVCRFFSTIFLQKVSEIVSSGVLREGLIQARNLARPAEDN
jgi:hypothetical protein